MAVYATLTDLADAATGTWVELAQRAAPDAVLDADLLRATVHGADRSAWDAPSQALADAAVQRLQSALERASRHADTYLFPRYRQHMPLPPALVAASSLPAAVAAIAIKRLYGTQVPEDLRKATQWADDYLRDLSRGIVSLGQPDTEVPTPMGRVVTHGPAKSFDWERY